MPVMDLHKVLHVVVIDVPLPNRLLISRLSLPLSCLFSAHRAQTHDPLTFDSILILALLQGDFLSAKRCFKCFVQIFGLLSWCYDLNLLLRMLC